MLARARNGNGTRSLPAATATLKQRILQGAFSRSSAPALTRRSVITKNSSSSIRRGGVLKKSSARITCKSRSTKRRYQRSSTLVGQARDTDAEHLKEHGGRYRKDCPRCFWIQHRDKLKRICFFKDRFNQKVSYIKERPVGDGKEWALGCWVCAEGVQNKLT